MSNKCWDCGHWKSKGNGELYAGRCMLQSCDCATAIINRTKPPYFLPKELIVGTKLPIIVRQNSMDGYSMSVKALVGASENRNRQNPMMVDVRELTDESKKELSRDRAAMRKKKGGTNDVS